MRATVLTLEGQQEAELRELMRQAYHEGASVFGELRRDPSQHGDIKLVAGIVPRKAAEKIAKILAETKTEQNP